MAKRILIVDDQEDLRKLVRMTLEAPDYALHEAENGAHALDLLPQLWPDLVVLDVMLPGGMDGIEVCEAIKHRTGMTHIKVLLLSAKGQRSDLERGRHAGADGYLVKPFSPLELIQKVAGLLA
jgi:CheY-like chemotaxis protein